MVTTQVWELSYSMNVHELEKGIGIETNWFYTYYLCPGHESVLWKVPVTIATSKNPAAVKFVLEGQSTTVTVEGVGPDDWIMVREE